MGSTKCRLQSREWNAGQVDDTKIAKSSIADISALVLGEPNSLVRLLALRCSSPCRCMPASLTLRALPGRSNSSSSERWGSPRRSTRSTAPSRNLVFLLRLDAPLPRAAPACTARPHASGPQVTLKRTVRATLEPTYHVQRDGINTKVTHIHLDCLQNQDSAAPAESSAEASPTPILSDHGGLLLARSGQPRWGHGGSRGALSVCAARRRERERKTRTDGFLSRPTASNSGVVNRHSGAEHVPRL